MRPMSCPGVCSITCRRATAGSFCRAVPVLWRTTTLWSDCVSVSRRRVPSQLCSGERQDLPSVPGAPLTFAVASSASCELTAERLLLPC